MSRAELISDVQVGNLKYRLDTEKKTATITGHGPFPGYVNVNAVEYEGQKYTVNAITHNVFDGCTKLTYVSVLYVTLVGYGAFANCSSLQSVFMPSVTSLGQDAFFVPNALTSLTLNVKVKSEIEKNGRSYYGIPEDATITYFDLLPEDVVGNAAYVVQEAVFEPAAMMVVTTPPSVTLKSGGEVLNEDDYKTSCKYYGLSAKLKPSTPQIPDAPPADDYKVVSKDAEIIQEGEIAVTKESIAAPSAGTVKVEENKVQLGVTVLKTADLTDEKKDWDEVTLTADDVKVVDGKIVISVPVDSASGFMVIKTKDAKIETEE